MDGSVYDIVLRDTLNIPASPDGSTAVHIIDLGRIHETEARLAEISFVTKEKSPELLFVFNKATLDCSRALANLQNLYNKGQRLATQRAAIVKLDLAKEQLAARGLVSGKSPAGSEDLRDALVASDDKYNQIMDYCDYLKAAIMLFQGKQKAFERGYFSIHKLISPNQNDGNVLSDSDTRIGIEEEAGQTQKVIQIGGTRIGRPKY